ncbi:MAG: T9SS type A sorting domain-containing protein, partial [Flavobacteriales bacterium]
TEQISCFGADDGFISIEAQTSDGSLTYTWSNGESTPSLQDLSPGVYSLLISSDAACPVNQTVQFEIFEPAELLATYEIATNEIALTISGGTPTYSIAWNTPSGIVLNEMTLAINGEGTYTYTVADAHDCQFSQSIQVTSVSVQVAFATEVFPNPIAGDAPFSIRSEASITELEVLDSKGSIIQRIRPASFNVELSTSAWANGIYLIRIHSEQGTVSRRIIKQ